MQLIAWKCMIYHFHLHNLLIVGKTKIEKNNKLVYMYNIKKNIHVMYHCYLSIKQDSAVG